MPPVIILIIKSIMIRDGVQSALVSKIQTGERIGGATYATHQIFTRRRKGQLSPDFCSFLIATLWRARHAFISRMGSLLTFSA